MNIQISNVTVNDLAEILKLNEAAVPQVNSVDLTKMGVDKLLGSGRISKPVSIKVGEASPKAMEKLKKAGGALVKE